MKQLFFTPGPAELYFTVETHVKNALNEHIPSVSHRSKAFEGIYREAVQNLKDLLELPDNYHIFFTGSATEIWERILENCVESQSYHYVNGAFSKRFYETGLQLKKNPLHQKAADGTCSSVNTSDIPDTTELIVFTQNETSTGAAQPLSDIYTAREAHPGKLIAVDAVSSLPYIDIDYHKVDTVFFSVQKGFGLPAGLGVWLVNDRCLEKADQLATKGINIGTYHSLPSLLAKAQKNQTPETPNVLGIYLLAKVAGDMLKKGIGRIRQESEYKAAVLYNLIEHHARFSPFVKEAKYRSSTVIVAETVVSSSEIIQKLLERNLVIGTGYGTYKNQHIRIANFPTHSREKVEMLADYLQAM